MCGWKNVIREGRSRAVIFDVREGFSSFIETKTLITQTTLVNVVPTTATMVLLHSRPHFNSSVRPVVR